MHKTTRVIGNFSAKVARRETFGNGIGLEMGACGGGGGAGVEAESERKERTEGRVSRVEFNTRKLEKDCSKCGQSCSF